MSETIHAFGENGELSRGAELALDHFMTGTVNPAIAAAAFQGGGDGTLDHALLTNRSALNQHPISAITNLTATLANKSDLDHQHPIGAITGLQDELDSKAEATHTHTIGEVSNLWETLGGKTEVGHTHTAAEISDATTTGRAVMQASSETAARTAIGAGTSNLQLGTGPTTAAAGNHTHDDRYYTEAEADERFVRTVNNTGPDENGNVTVSSGGGGETDHGALTGLSDDDHPQYALADGTRGSFAAANHSHAISDVTGLQSELDGKQPAGSYAPASHTHTEYVETTDPRLSDARTPTAHSHTISNVTGLQGALDGKASTTHNHDNRYYTESEVDTALAGKADAAQTINALYAETTYTLVSSDAGKLVTFGNSRAQTLTVPASVFTAGQRVDVLRRTSGTVTIAAGSGMTLNGTPSLMVREQWSVATVLFLSATEAVVFGDLSSPFEGGKG